MALPEFLGIGAMKAASSLLFTLLNEHPQIYMAGGDVKEVRFFNRYYDKGVDWYADLFQPGPGQIPGEVTPDYLYRKECPERIAKVVPNVKMVAILRDPVERTYSQFTHFVQERGFAGTFREYLTEHPNAIERSLYHEQIQRYLGFFPRENLQILLFEHFTQKPLKTMPEVYRFIGVDPDFVPTLAGKRVNATMPRDVARIYAMGRKTMERMKMLGLGTAVELIKKTPLKDWLMSRSKGKATFPPMTEDDKKFIVESVTPDLEALERFMDQDLRAVWKLGQRAEQAR